MVKEPDNSLKRKQRRERPKGGVPGIALFLGFGLFVAVLLFLGPPLVSMFQR